MCVFVTSWRTSETMVWVFTTSWRMSETTTSVVIESSVWTREVSNDNIEVTEPTLKISRALPRSDLQVAIASLSSFARRSRETALRLPNLTMFLWIWTTDLRLPGAWYKCIAQPMHHWSSSRCQLPNRFEH